MLWGPQRPACWPAGCWYGRDDFNSSAARRLTIPCQISDVGLAQIRSPACHERLRSFWCAIACARRPPVLLHLDIKGRVPLCSCSSSSSRRTTARRRSNGGSWAEEGGCGAGKPYPSGRVPNILGPGCASSDVVRSKFVPVTTSTMPTLSSRSGRRRRASRLPSWSAPTSAAFALQKAPPS